MVESNVLLKVDVGRPKRGMQVLFLLGDVWVLA